MLPILIAKGATDLFLLPEMANRHGLIAGATGTGKTVTLQVLAENFSALGVPVFMADIKGDLTGISQPGGQNSKVTARIQDLKLDAYDFRSCPVTLWDVFGEQGHPVRATVSEMGPLLFSRLLQLNETQSGVLSLVFKIADQAGLLLLISRICEPLSSMWEIMPRNSPPSTGIFRRPASEPSSAVYRAWNHKEARNFLASLL
jgi:hypothetical protein